MEQSKHLKVNVFKNGDRTVALTMPIYSLNIIDTLIPEPALKVLRDKGLNLNSIISKVKQSQYRPQSLFEEEALIDNVHKRYKVWIE